MSTFTLQSNSPDETAKLAERLKPFLGRGDIILLSGALAAGKTHFVSSLVSALGSGAAVSSPTYTIAHHYKSETCPVLHIDVYRLSGVGEFRDLTLDDYFEDSLVLIEWGDMVQTAFPQYLKIEFQFGDSSTDARIITISYKGEKWQGLFSDIKQALEEVC